MVAKDFVEKHKPRMFVLLEPRVSGFKADSVIHSLKFQKSHRIKALGFSGGIWVMWNEDWQVRVVYNHR